MVNPQEKTMKIDRLHRHPIRRIARAMGLLGTGMFILILAACDSTPLPTDVSGQTASDAEMDDQLAASYAGTNQDLAAVRRATASFHNFDKADAAGYGTELTACAEQLPDGAQGFHYANLALIGDGTVSLLEPELLMYEPQASGRLRLVGVEYIVLLDFDQPDPLFGQQFHANEAAGVWALHLWNWRHNPDGMVEDWNPNVSCEYAD